MIVLKQPTPIKIWLLKESVRRALNDSIDPSFHPCIFLSVYPSIHPSSHTEWDGRAWFAPGKGLFDQEWPIHSCSTRWHLPIYLHTRYNVLSKQPMVPRVSLWAWNYSSAGYREEGNSHCLIAWRVWFCLMRSDNCSKIWSEGTCGNASNGAWASFFLNLGQVSIL